MDKVAFTGSHLTGQSIIRASAGNLKRVSLELGGKSHRLAKAIRAGSVWISCYQAMDPAVPFGGYKMSGYGRVSGVQHLERYLNVKAVWIKID